MTDVLTPVERHRNMAAIRGKNTKPEMLVRRLAFGLGYRYRLHCKDLPGKPDIVFRSRRKVIEVRGCYWHMHDCKYGNVIPKTQTSFWQNKRLATVSRDNKNLQKLQDMGWQVLIIWECEMANKANLIERIKNFLS